MNFSCADGGIQKYYFKRVLQHSPHLKVPRDTCTEARISVLLCLLNSYMKNLKWYVKCCSNVYCCKVRDQTIRTCWPINNAGLNA